MIRLGQQVRLTRKEAENFAEITGFLPDGVRTIADLDAYVAKCKQHYKGKSRETRFLHWLLDQEKLRCLG